MKAILMIGSKNKTLEEIRLAALPELRFEYGINYSYKYRLISGNQRELIIVSEVSDDKETLNDYDLFAKTQLLNLFPEPHFFLLQYYEFRVLKRFFLSISDLGFIIDNEFGKFLNATEMSTIEDEIHFNQWQSISMNIQAQSSAVIGVRNNYWL